MFETGVYMLVSRVCRGLQQNELLPCIYFCPNSNALSLKTQLYSLICFLPTNQSHITSCCRSLERKTRLQNFDYPERNCELSLEKNHRSLALLLKKILVHSINIMMSVVFKCCLNGSSSIKEMRLKRRDGCRKIKRED